jgi:hypothetical protein
MSGSEKTTVGIGRTADFEGRSLLRSGQNQVDERKTSEQAQ